MQLLTINDAKIISGGASSFEKDYTVLGELAGIYAGYYFITAVVGLPQASFFGALFIALPTMLLTSHVGGNIGSEIGAYIDQYFEA